MKCHRSLGQRSGVRFIVACSKQPRKQHSAVETVARLESLLKAKDIKTFEAKAAGLAMRPTVLLSSAIRKRDPFNEPVSFPRAAFAKKGFGVGIRG
jgi:hypothetical protein